MSSLIDLKLYFDVADRGRAKSSARMGRAPAFRPASVGKAVRQAAVAIILEVVRFYRSRSVLARFGQMSDSELKDIGLMRQDVRDATGLGFGQDASVMLARRVDQRRPTMWA